MVGGYTNKPDKRYKEIDWWQCYDCDRWFPDDVAHGHFRDPEVKLDPLKERREKELKLAWKKSR